MNYKTRIPFAVKSSPCNMVDAAYKFSVTWLLHLGDRASQMTCDNRLVIAAQKHAEYLYNRTPDLYTLGMHIGSNNSFANERAMAEGYKLPDYFPRYANNIESCLRAGSDPVYAVQALLDSPSHYNHLMGINGFENHIVYGIGYYITDWVVLIAPKE